MRSSLFRIVACFLPTAARALGPRSPDASGQRVCTVTAKGQQHDDVPQTVQAFEDCGNGGTIVFPEDQTYWIATKLNPVVHNVTIEWRGIWQFSDDLDYWRNNSYPIAFQNHQAGFILTGDGIHIDGFGTGGIHGNGDIWYTAEAGHTLPGRPMPFVLWNVSDVTVSRFSIEQPQLWAFNIMNGTNIRVDQLYCNATATKAPWGSNWVQNTDGFDTMDVKNVYLSNLVYQGGDDCIAIKPRSYDVSVYNMTCRGGNGIAIGSLGQYLEDSSVENVVVDNVTIIRYNEDMKNGAYIKTWIGEQAPQSNYESAGLPNGGGWGHVRNILFSNFNIQGADLATAISQSNGNPKDGTFSGTSNMLVSNVAFVNFTGSSNITAAKSARVNSISCSQRHPCYNIDYQNFMVAPMANASALGLTTCEYIEEGGVHGEDCTSG
ncbi:putative galacturan 1,4-alpha-galacturonidase C [Cladophialophora carrionii]|uniref:galacturonan 1,4-alpha-galacturonidase n=1 Tax=Cladophialophora carrionii TaxID=86049 RepID=A0A1C1CTZ5_9EURO|nr:putative galacturan 1,4-alpha-galacturonidase C [Cladophialophora carrionii]